VLVHAVRVVGYYTARQRKAEAENLNEQLHTINARLRQQTSAGVIQMGPRSVSVNVGMS
jgi:hypothetical protein